MPACSHTHGNRSTVKSWENWSNPEYWMQCFLRDIYTFILPCTCKSVHQGLITHSCYQFGGPAMLFLSIQSPHLSHWHHGKCIGHLTHAPHVSEYISHTLISSWPPCSTQSCVGGLPEHLPVNQLLEMSSSLWYKTHTVFHAQMSGFFFFFMFNFSSPWLLSVKRHQPLSRDTETCVFETFGTADIVLMSTCLTQRPFVCMLYWLLLPQPRSIDRKLWPVNRAANPACLWIFFFFFFWLQLLMSKVVSVVFVSLAAWQVHRQQLIVFRVTAEQQRWRGWGKVEGRLSGHCGPALMQLTTATDAGAVYPWWRHVFGLVCMCGWINHPLAHAQSVSLNAHMCFYEVKQQQCPAHVWSRVQLDSAATSQNCVIGQTSLWRLTQCIKYSKMWALSCQIQF